MTLINLHTTPTLATSIEYAKALDEVAKLKKLDEHLRDIVFVAVRNMQIHFGYKPSARLLQLIA